MSELLLIPAALMALLTATLSAAVVVRIVRQRRRRQRRVVEAPNSHHTWQKVRERELCERWRNIALDRMHPINRDEVVRLLDIVQVGGPDALRPRERTFLDYMAELVGTIEPPPGGGPVARDPRDVDASHEAGLRHRTT
jgi:hypothetical protein